MPKIIASYKETKALIDYHQISIRKRWGQNFLINQNIVEKIVLSCGEITNQAIIEIGPGLGSLTQFLIKEAGHVTAYEIDEKLSLALKENFLGQENLEIINQDFLRVDLKELSLKLLKDYSRISIVANLPYYITTPVLFHIIESQVEFQQITLMMQKEVALRLSALKNTKDYGSLSVIIQYLSEVDYLFTISNQVFYPKPKVDSALISLKRKVPTFDLKSEALFFKFIKDSFRFRRKTLTNNLKDVIDLKELNKALEKLDFDPKIRAESLSLEDYLRLFKELYEKEIIRES